MAWVLMICAGLAVAAVDQPAPLAAAGLAAISQDAGADKDAVADLEGLTVVGRRGGAGWPPEFELGPAGIDALGAYDIGEVISRTTQIIGSRDSPIVLVNGRRIANPGVFLGLPADALVRIEALPHEAGARLAGDANRRVLNIVLQPRFHSRDMSLAASSPVAGGTTSATGDVRRAAIADSRTSHVGLRVSRESSLTVGERSAARRDRGTDNAVTLRPATDGVSANLMLSRMIGDWSATFDLNGRREASRMVTRGDRDLLETRRRAAGGGATTGLSGELAGWAVQFGLDGQLARSDQGTATDRTTNGSLTGSLEANRTLAELTAGPLIVNLSGRYVGVRSTVVGEGAHDVRRSETTDLAANLAIPLWRSAAGAAGRGPGMASASLGLGRRRSGAGGGDGANFAFSWTPLPELRLSAAWAVAGEGITDEQRFAPVFYGAPITVFDPRTGGAADVLPLLGGDPRLRAAQTTQTSVGVSVGPFGAWRVAAAVNVQRRTAADGVGVLPSPTEEIEARFPERFQRDAAGRLVGIDLRPLNLGPATSEIVSMNLTLAVPLRGAGREGAEATLLVGLNHTWRKRDLVRLAEGAPALDRLQGDLGGTPRQDVSLTIDGRWIAWGFNGVARWRDGYRIRQNAGADASNDLRVTSSGTIDLRVSYQFERSFPVANANGAPRRGVGARLELGVENVLDSRPRARLEDGAAAPGYGRDDQDPIGRRVRLTLNQRF